MSVFRKAVSCLLVALPSVAQPQAFAKISVRPARSADSRNMRVQVRSNGDLIASAVPVVTLLSYAYDVPVNPSPRLSALPDRTPRERYDIEAKAPANARPSWSSGERGTTPNSADDPRIDRRSFQTSDAGRE